MSGVLLDTNVVSELTRPAPDKRVVAYLRDLDRAFISAVTVHELQYGIARLPAGKRRNSLSRVVDRLLVEYEDAILPVGRHEAYRAGGLRAMEESGGRVLHLADAFIAATALQHGLTLATRNVGDFLRLGVALYDPWNA